MATHDLSNIIAEDGAVELEAMRREDSSWHPCQVSLSSTGAGLTVDYANMDSEDRIENEEEAMARLRIRSAPLHGDDCLHIQEGELVLATHKSLSKNLFFDAEVEKALRVRHSKKVHCRCNFIVKWLHQDHIGGTVTVSSSSIMKLATKSINLHPTVGAFLSTLKSLSCSNASPLPSVIEDMDCEMDLHEMLEKQIEEISNSTDVSKKRIPDNILFGVEVDNKGQIQCRAFGGSTLMKSHVQVHFDLNNLRRTTRSTNKLQIEMEIKEPPPSAPSIQEEVLESRSPLNPLAARAALASLMSKMPENLEISMHHEEKIGCTYSADNITCNYGVMQSLNGTKAFKSPAGNSFPLTDKLSLQTAATSVPFHSDTTKNLNWLISTSRPPGKLQHMDLSSGILPKERESEDKTSGIPDSKASITSSSAKRNIMQPSKEARVTRSAVKGAGIPDHTVEEKTYVEEKKLASSTNTRRFTRSAVHKEIQTLDTKQGMEEHVLGKPADSDFSHPKVAVLGSYAVKDETKSCTALKNSTIRTRLTRSAVHEKEYKTRKVTHGMEEDNSSEGDVFTCKSNALKIMERTSSPLDAEDDLPATLEMYNTEKMSCAVKAAEKTEGKVMGNGESCRSLKRKCTSSKKQELRFSPRLRFLPQTRSNSRN